MPPDNILWDGTPEDLDDWLNMVFDKKYQSTTEVRISEIEG